MAACIAACGSSKTMPAGEPGMTWQSIASLPDLSGWWEWQYTDEYSPPQPDGARSLPQIGRKMQMKPQIVQAITTILQPFLTQTSNRTEQFGASNACVPPYFLGTNGTAWVHFEILPTPGRVTIADELGLVRRIDIGATLPAAPMESNAGTSVGHWEGDTLVVETAGIDRKRKFLFTQYQVGKDIHVLERFRLKEPDMLEVSVEMTAPELLTSAFKDTLIYKRRRDHRFTDENYCAEYDRSIDHKAGKEQLDLTPPGDLPPPPAG
jgi:hypothetical protein